MQNFENDLLSGIDRYTKVEDSLSAYPEWQDKVKDQIGSWYHLIHNNLAESESKRKVFQKLVNIFNSLEQARILHMIVKPTIICSSYIDTKQYILTNLNLKSFIKYQVQTKSSFF